ncbi:MAG: hypothetical protein E2O39_05690 [Planctomycetota bacterium]|nr:MAG: hypothetical protein E2O39_05690 [Planctomycetota bacterium]
MHAMSRFRGAIPVLAAVLIAGCSSTGERLEAAGIRQEVEATAIVTGIDSMTREIMLERPDGVRFVIVAGPEVRNFDQINVGETVKARYIESLTARLLGPDEPDAPTMVAVTAARAAVGQDPAGAIAAGMELTVVVESVDPTQHLVVFTTPTGQLRVIRARRKQGRKFIAGLKPGDRVALVFGESVVVTVE